jgi:RNA-directed DNA polymerase
MKRLAIRLEDLAERANLVLAVWKASRGKTAQPAVARFLAGLDGNLDVLAASILDGSAPSGHASRFVIHDPKQRVIHAACFADRVLHHAILNLAEPRFETMLVASTYACRPGKGVHAAVAAVQQGLRAWPWFVQVDVDAYFPSIRHDLLLALLARRFKGAGFLDLLGRIVARGCSSGVPGCGLPIGALTSQHFANAFLDSADRLLLDLPGTGAHVRYMDDIFWGCASRAVAEDSLTLLATHLETGRGLRLKAGPRIARSAEGARYCGFRVRQGVVLPSPRKMHRFRAAMARIEQAQFAGQADEGQIQRAADTGLATLAGCQSLDFRRRVLAAGVYSEGSGCPST